MVRIVIISQESYGRLSTYSETVEKTSEGSFGPYEWLILLYVNFDKGQYLDFFDSHEAIQNPLIYLSRNC